MLERISGVQGIGLFHNANGKAHGLHKATLIYGDNGRGKSTLATLFRSVSTGNAALLAGAKTIDGTLAPEVALQFANGHKVNYASGAWSESRPEILVFDAEFIGRNVHSGGSVSTDHRKNLLEFALGEAAVAARQAVDSSTLAAKSATEIVNALVAQISGHHLGMLLASFQALPDESDIDLKIVDLQKRLQDAGNIAAIQAKPVPEQIVAPTLNLQAIFLGLSRSLENVHASAEQVVKQHVAKLKGEGAEEWINKGTKLVAGSACPFCDQDVSTSNLVLAYQTHFNEAYAQLKVEVAELNAIATQGTRDDIFQNISNKVALGKASTAAWIDHLQVSSLDFDEKAAQDALTSLRGIVVGLTLKKTAAPAEPFGTELERTEALSKWTNFLAEIENANQSIANVQQQVHIYKTQLVGETAIQLQQQILKFQAIKRRYDPQVAGLLAQLSTANAALVNCDKAKKAARESLDGLMVTTLAKYQTSINTLLKQFGASFSIRGMTANFRGNAPRSDYGIQLRGRDVALDGGAPSFSTALSEGDKRTLAFAFFIATTLDDPKLKDRIVIIDDPMCSLDLNRRHQTRTILRKIHSKAEQLIVLAHDPYFLRDFREALKKEKGANPAGIAAFQLCPAPQSYTTFDVLDLDRECESDYARHRRILNEFSGGNGGVAADVAKAARPMLEGYLHRRFPNLLPKDAMFGAVVNFIKDAQPPSPLRYAANLVDELGEINDYVGQFHHDTNPDADNVLISATELKAFVDRCLHLVHSGQVV